MHLDRVHNEFKAWNKSHLLVPACNLSDGGLGSNLNGLDSGQEVGEVRGTILTAVTSFCTDIC